MTRTGMKEERHADHAPATEGNTVLVQGENQVPKGRMPHERDESADSQADEASATRRMGRLAHDAETSEQVDTGKGPALDAAYERQKGGEEKKRP